MVAACRVQDVPRITAALSVSIGLQIPGPLSVDPSRVVDATRIVQIKVGKGTGPFIGNDQLTGPETSPVTGHRSPVNGQH
ncbi:hypothetical protein DPMN_173602 [Dreissena polymorpha]|uniref:Uncharacterized protein n=1 Tax=Dreissena polymorpha TaxID=45954 RepID=A0A9D4IG89_DREPO|nr:hypothetical protein DPMN_173602 [Dreissena polymorpha]